MGKTTNDGSLKDANQITQIRDILLGPQKREYDEKFERSFVELKNAREELRTRSDELEDSFKAEIAALQHTFEQQIKRLSAMAEEQAAKLQQLVADTEEKIRADHKRDLDGTRTKLQSEMRSMKEQLTEELESHVAALSNVKVSRDAMAELLQEVVLKLKGVEIVEELQKAAQGGEEH